MTPEILEVLKRCEVLMDATNRFMEENPIAAEYTVDYDETTCDGSCLGDECAGEVEQLRSLISRAEKEGKNR